jgi:predicted RNA methylase
MVADIGIGTGMLMCGCIYIGAAFTFGYEIDQQYIEQTRHMLD